MFVINKKYLPSKNFTKALLSAVGIVLLAITINYWKSNTDTYKNNDLFADLSTSSPSLNNNVDTDGDGLPDWQEGLYGTDPKKSDTDGDGTLDGEEIRLNRDPLKANIAKNDQEPNDKIDPKLLASDQKIINDYQNLSLTAKISRDLISNIIASQPTNSPMSQNTIDSIAEKALENIANITFSSTTQQSDLNIIPINQETLNKDITKFISIYFTQTESFRKIMGDDLRIINNTSISFDFKKNELKKVTDKYLYIINAMIKNPIPAVSVSTVLKYHLRIINDIEKLIQVDNNIINTKDDKAVVFSNLTMYNSIINDLTLSLGYMDNILKIERK